MVDVCSTLTASLWNKPERNKERNGTRTVTSLKDASIPTEDFMTGGWISYATHAPMV